MTLIQKTLCIYFIHIIGIRMPCCKPAIYCFSFYTANWSILSGSNGNYVFNFFTCKTFV